MLNVKVEIDKIITHDESNDFSLKLINNELMLLKLTMA